MAYCVLALVVELGHRDVAGVLVGEEGGVVAEAPLAARMLSEATGAAPLEDALYAGHGIDVGERAHIGERTAGGSLGEQLGEVLLVGGVLAGVAGRAHSRCAAERGRFDARVIGDAGRAGRERRGASLAEGVLLEGGAVLRRQSHLIRQRIDVEAGEQARDLATLVLVAGGQQQSLWLAAGGGGLTACHACLRRRRAPTAERRATA